MTRGWERAIRSGSIDDLQHMSSEGADINARDQHGQTGLMLAATEGRAAVVHWLIDRGGALNHTAKYGLSAVMLAVVRGRADIVQALADAGADLTLRGTGAPGFASKTALDLAVARGDPAIVEILRAAEAKRRL